MEGAKPLDAQARKEKKENNLREGTERRQRKRETIRLKKTSERERKNAALRKRGMKRNDEEGQENNNKETRRQANARRRSGVHSCFLLVSGYSSRGSANLVSPCLTCSMRILSLLAFFPIALTLERKYERSAPQSGPVREPLSPYSSLWDSRILPNMQETMT